MRAIRYTAAGGPEVIQLRDAPTPEPGPRQVRVRVHASALNRADILQRRGRYPAPAGWPADIPGLEYAGEGEALGPGVTRWQVGDRVMGLVGGGAHAEFVVVHADETMAVPEGMAYTDAAAIPEAFLTAWDALVARGRLVAGERVLIHAVGSGVGTAAVQLAKRIGATVAGTSRSAAKLAQARALGLDEAIDTSTRGFGEQLDQSVDVILDVFGAPAFAANLDALTPRGRLVLLGFLQGATGELSLEPILRKRLEVIGTVMRTRSLEERIPLVAAFAAEVVPAFGGSAARRPGDSAASLQPVVAQVFPFTDIVAAHAVMERDENFGKVVRGW